MSERASGGERDGGREGGRRVGGGGRGAQALTGVGRKGSVHSKALLVAYTFSILFD